MKAARNPHPAAIADDLAKLGITSTGACNLTPEQWRHVERLAGAALLTEVEKLAVLAELVNIERQRSDFRRHVRAMGVGA